MKRFVTFTELVNSFRNRSGNALIYDRGGSICSMTYPELAAAIFEEAGNITKPAPEVILADHTPDAIVRLFAAVISGCSVVLADPDLPNEWAYQVVKMLPEPAAPEDRDDDEGYEGEILFATSGTTARSKIVRLTSGSLCASAWSGQSMLACGESDRILSMLPLSHVFGFVCTMLWGFAYGAEIALGRGARHLVEDALYFKPTILPVVPTLIVALMRFHALNPELRVVLVGAAPCSRETTASLSAAGIDVYFGYGLTETSSGIAITQDLDEPEALYPCPGADIRIEADGEVSVATPCMMKGYLGQPEMQEGARFMTGDLGSFDEKGRLHLSGRKKDVIITADGTKIYCPEYETELSQATGCPELALIMKNGHAALVSFGVDRDKVKEAVGEFNRGKMRSQQIYDLIEAEGPLPRTVTGKLKRYEIQEKYS